MAVYKLKTLLQLRIFVLVNSCFLVCVRVRLFARLFLPNCSTYSLTEFGWLFVDIVRYTNFLTYLLYLTSPSDSL